LLQCNFPNVRAYFTDTYGPTGGWCWLDVYRCDGTNLIHKLILFYYVTNWFFIILNSFLIYKVLSIISNSGKRNYSLLLMANKLKYFPIIHIVCILPSTVSRIYNVFDLESNFILVLFQTIFGSLNGVGYLAIYLMIPQVNNSLKILFNRFKKPEKSQENTGNSSMDLSSEFIENNLKRKEITI
jgi:hypothetical protein